MPFHNDITLSAKVKFMTKLPQIFGIGVFVCFIGETRNGVGMHTKYIRPDEFKRMLHWQFFHSLIVTVGISLVKLSVAFFLLRLVPGKNYKWFLYGVIGMLPSRFVQAINISSIIQNQRLTICIKLFS